jgi:hypothetical protein
MIELGLLLVLGVGGIILLLTVATVIKTVLWVVLLPFRLVFWVIGALLVIPFLLFKFLFGGLILLLALPIIVLSLLAGLAAAAAALFLPLLPFVLLAVLLWYLIRPESQALVRG